LEPADESGGMTAENENQKDQAASNGDIADAPDGVPTSISPRATTAGFPPPLPPEEAVHGAAQEGAPSSAGQIPSQPERSFFARTWVRIAAAAVAAIILLGGGIGIGAALSQGGGPAAGDEVRGPGDPENTAPGGRGGDEGERHRHDDEDRGSTSDEDSDRPQVPAPSTSP
jgi:hypothetical protein